MIKKLLLSLIASISLGSTITSLSFNNKVNATTTSSSEDLQTSSNAETIQDQENYNLPDFDNMSVQEINNYIDEKVNEQKTFNSLPYNYLYGQSYISIPGTVTALRAMWIAAGAIAKKVGYPCAGTLVQYSARHRNYTEWSRGGGLLASHIRRTRVYKRAKRENARSIDFTKADSKDLYYALHLVKSNFHYTKRHPVHISDTFDFKLMASYRSPFTAAVNNWGYLSSHINVLYPSKINIYF